MFDFKLAFDLRSYIFTAIVAIQRREHYLKIFKIQIE